MIVRHFIRVPVGSTVYCDNQPVKILEKGYALALCDVNGKRVYITCYDLEKKPFGQHEWGRMKKSQPTHDHESALPYTIMMQIYYLLLK